MSDSNDDSIFFLAFLCTSIYIAGIMTGLGASCAWRGYWTKRIPGRAANVVQQMWWTSTGKTHHLTSDCFHLNCSLKDKKDIKHIPTRRICEDCLKKSKLS